MKIFLYLLGAVCIVGILFVLPQVAFFEAQEAKRQGDRKKYRKKLQWLLAILACLAAPNSKALMVLFLGINLAFWLLNRFWKEG